MVTFLIGIENTSFQSKCSSNSSFSVKYLIEVGGLINFWTNFVYILLQVNDATGIMAGIMDLSVMQSYFAMILCGLHRSLVK